MKVAFLGNSILYFNDCPRLVQQMLQQQQQQSQHQSEVIQDSCLRGGATLTKLWDHGNGMKRKFAGPNSIVDATTSPPSFDVGAPTPHQLLTSENWDFIVMNDQTRSPIQPVTRQDTITVLRNKYVPLFQQLDNAVIVLLQTFAYRYPGMQGTQGLDFTAFTKSLREGYEAYRDVITEAMGSTSCCRIAPVGDAVLWLYQHDNELWQKLYSWDGFHPSPLGTWLEACVLVCTMTLQEPPAYNPDWFNKSRFMQPLNEKPLPLPTPDDAERIRRVACSICNITVAEKKEDACSIH